MDKKIEIVTIKIADYVNVGIENINTNFQKLKEGVEALYYNFIEDVDKKILSSDKLKASDIEVSGESGIQFFGEQKGESIGSITIDKNTNTTTAQFDKIVVKDMIKLDSAAEVKQFDYPEYVPETGTIEFNSDSSEYIVSFGEIFSPQSPEIASDDFNSDVVLDFSKCVDGQVINIIFGSLNGRTINSIQCDDKSEFANNYNPDFGNHRILSDDMVKEGDYSTQLSFIVKKIIGGENNSKIIVKN